MGVVTYEYEATSQVSPSRLFKAIVLEPHKHLPLAVPQAIKNLEVLQGDGGRTGSILKINFVEGLPLKYVKDKIEVVDKDNLAYGYSVIEGGPLGNKLEKISIENKFVATTNGGTVRKSLMKYYTIGESLYNEDEIKVVIEGAEVIYKAVETYLLDNPDVCN